MFEIEVRPSKVYIIPTVLVAIITIYPIYEVIQNQNEASIILLIIMCIALVLIARVAQVNCRTIIFDEEGCRVARGKKNISYAWEEIKIIRIEKYGFGFMQEWDEAVFFSVGKLKKPRKIPPSLFNIFTNSFENFFVYLVPEDGKKNSPNNHVCPKYEFIKKTQEWGVEIEGLSLEEKEKSNQYLTSNQNNWEWNINATEQEYQIRLDENKTRKTFEIYINDEKVYEQKRIRMIWLGLDYSFQIENKQCRVVFDVMNWEMDLLIDNQDFKTGKKYASKIKGFLELCIIMIILFVGLLLIHIGMWWIYIPFVVVAIGGVHWGLKHIDIK